MVNHKLKYISEQRDKQRAGPQGSALIINLNDEQQEGGKSRIQPYKQQTATFRQLETPVKTETI